MNSECTENFGSTEETENALRLIAQNPRCLCAVRPLWLAFSVARFVPICNGARERAK
jgi:hypothetical protein